MRSALRFILGAIYLIAGLAHLWTPRGFIQITPQWVPAPHVIVMLTGLFEIVAGILLAFVPKLRRPAGIALAAYAILVFPANINHALNDIAIGDVDLDWWYHGPRLLFQPIAVWWALWVGDVTDWPFGAKR